jgi:hypothetical protein
VVAIEGAEHRGGARRSGFEIWERKRRAESVGEPARGGQDRRREGRTALIHTRVMASKQ